MAKRKGFDDKKFNEILHLLDLRQELLREQGAVNIEGYEIDIKIKKMRDTYGLQLDELRKRLERKDTAAVKELRAMFEEFLEAFDDQYQRQLKLRKKAEYIQEEIYKTVEEIIK
ncbi:MAG: hypothetical protein N2484_12545 [Clostridia bacterium]|nr:hypothetical protein [Clostridia bacterium]